EVDNDRQPGGVLEHHLVILAIEHQRFPGRSPWVGRTSANCVGEDDLVDEADGDPQEGMQDTGKLLRARYGQDGQNSAHQPRDRADHALDELIDGKQHAGLSETLLYHRCRMADLRLSVWHWLAVDQLDQHRYMARLDDIKDVFARPVHDGAKQAEPHDGAPHGRIGLKSFVTEAANAIA